MKKINRLWNFLFPQPAICIICEKPLSEGGICDECLRSMHEKRLKIGFCKRCNTFGSYGSVCDSCRHWPAYLVRHQAPFVYENEVRESIHHFKYNGESWRYAYYLKALEDFIPHGVDTVVPIPLHKSRLQSRGYNQSALLAKMLAKEADLIYAEALWRVKETKQQTGLSKTARQKNIKNAFAFNPKHQAKICDKYVLLIDDVFTTGSTFAEAGKILHQHGAKQVYGLSLAAVRFT